jgi:hypothetical protein
MANVNTAVAVERSSAPAQGGTTAREDFGGSELAVTGETAASTVAAQAQAAVQARYVMALKRPRDLDDVRVRLLKECRRPGFAEVARYHKPVGEGIEGPSIRFVEAALRCYGNVYPETTTIYDDERKRIVRVSVTDLEANVTYTRDVTVDKVVERSKLRPGQTPLSVRTNSQGNKSYLVTASEDDLLNKEGALVSKALRTLGLRVIPGDLVDEAMALVYETLANSAAKDPDAERKKLADAFARLGVMPSDLKVYLGHELDQSSPAEIVGLRTLYQAIKDGEATWAAALEQKQGPKDPAAGVTAQTDATKSKIAEKLAAAKGAPAPAPAAKPEATPATPATAPTPPATPAPLGEKAQALFLDIQEAETPGHLPPLRRKVEKAASDKVITESELAVLRAQIDAAAAAFAKAEAGQ